MKSKTEVTNPEAVAIEDINTSREAPVDARHSIETANKMVKAGIEFVVVPVLNVKHRLEMNTYSMKVLDRLLEAIAQKDIKENSDGL